MTATSFFPFGRAALLFPTALLMLYAVGVIYGLLTDDFNTQFFMCIFASPLVLCLFFMFKGRRGALIGCAFYMLYTGLGATTTSGIMLFADEMTLSGSLVPVYALIALVGGVRLCSIWNAGRAADKPRKL